MATPRKPLLDWKSTLLAALALLGALSAVAAYSVYRNVTGVIAHSYAAWTTGDLLVEYMETHDANGHGAGLNCGKPGTVLCGTGGISIGNLISCQTW
jgi:hypothetical protein